MNFVELQNELCAVPAARFKAAQRDSIKRWINYRYAQLWDVEEWSFRKAVVNATVTGGTFTAPSDFAAPRGLWDASGNRLAYLEPRDFYTLHLPAVSAGTPGIFTVVDGQVILDPTTDSGSFPLWYDRACTPLAADGDVPQFPSQHHYILVHGATATGSVQVNDFTYQFAEQQWQNGIDVMRREYLADQSEETQQWGSYMETWRQ